MRFSKLYFSHWLALLGDPISKRILPTSQPRRALPYWHELPSAWELDLPKCPRHKGTFFSVLKETASDSCLIAFHPSSQLVNHRHFLSISQKENPFRCVLKVASMQGGPNSRPSTLFPRISFI